MNNDQPQFVITNVNIFDGTSDQLAKGMSVLIEDNKISKIGKDIQAPKDATVIDAKGCTLTPGLIDSHTHLIWNLGELEMLSAPQDYLAALAINEARDTLMRGFTSIRDVAGSVFGIKQAIDEGYFEGPRIWCAGAAVTMTAGHIDVRNNSVPPRQMGGPAQTEAELVGMAIIADGVPEVICAARMQFRKGAHLLKMTVGGAVSGLYDPLDIIEYSFDEMKAAADEAKRWNTYLAIHAYTDQAIQQALNAGAMSIEHGTMITEDTVKLIKEKGAFLSTQTEVYVGEPPESWTPAQKERQLSVRKSLSNMFELVKEYKLKIALGTDLVGGAAKDVQRFELTNRLEWFTPAEILTQATANNGELLSWSGPRNPYPGKLGVIEEGALADILLVKGNPLENLELFNDPEENLLLIMKDGKIYKNIIK
jgi:imidazolonepropionase-like amidohydrolase